MKSGMLDRFPRELGAVSTRRSFMRLVSGAAAMGAGLVVLTHAESSAKSKHHGKAKSQAHDNVHAAGKSKKITICYNGTTRTVPKSKLASFPGATKGACPTGT